MFNMQSVVKQAYVFLWIDDGYILCGLLEVNHEGLYSFKYDTLYKERHNAISLDPITLPLLYNESFKSKKLFSIFRDAAPDKWGRKMFGILKNKFSEEFEDLEELDDFNVLTAFHSQNRIGALAFGQTPKEPCSFDKTFFSRQCTIPEIKKYAKTIQRIESVHTLKQFELFRNNATLNFFEVLAGSLSVGGARPKFLVNDVDSSWIAKLPEIDDVWNGPRVEHATMELARQCGISVASTRLLSFPAVDVLLVQRFDRSGGIPQHFMSAMTLNSLAEDGDWKSYQTIADTLRQCGGRSSDCKEVFRRMVFNGLISNFDDHPRNHAFFVTQSGIQLTPAYDLVPSGFGTKNRLSALICGKYGRITSIENYLSDVEHFGLTIQEAHQIITDMISVVMHWHDVFREHGVSDHDIASLGCYILPLEVFPVEEKGCGPAPRM